MKTLLSIALLFLLFCGPTSNAQSSYTVDGKEFSLHTEIDGPLSLLWNTIDGQYRYFLKKGESIVELKNTKSEGTYQEEYKEQLQSMTSDAIVSTEKVKFTRNGLGKFVADYNLEQNPSYDDGKEEIKFSTRLGAFAGISNIIYVSNPDNSFLPVLGIDFELLEMTQLRRHSLVVRFKQLLENSDYAYSSSQFSLNYRFKFVAKETFDIFLNTKFAGYTHTKREIIVGPNAIDIVSISDGNFDALGNFGLGADIALGKGHLTFMYNDIIALGLDTNGEFPIDFTVGYKLGL